MPSQVTAVLTQIDCWLDFEISESKKKKNRFWTFIGSFLKKK